MTSSVEAVLALQAAGAGGDGGDRQRGGVVDEERAVLQRLGRLDEAAHLLLGHVAVADLVRGDAGGLGEDAGGELLGGHLEREEADDAAFDRAFAAVGPGALLVGAGDVEGDVGGERGLAHRGAAGEDQEVGGVQAAEALVEVDEAGGEAGEAAVALVGGVGDLDRVDDGAAEGLEAAVDLALLAELVERLLGLDDLVLGLAVDLDAGGLLGDALAEDDELAADGEVVDELGVVAGGEERDRGAGEADEVGGAAELLEAGVLLEEGLDGDRGGQRVAADALGGDLEDAGVHRVEEVRRLHDARRRGRRRRC